MNDITKTVMYDVFKDAIFIVETRYKWIYPKFLYVELGNL